jgi:glycosyltransferase involved in cell wall biosynthesis
LKQHCDLNSKVSVCIPCYEMHGYGVKYLRELLDSLQNQTFTNFEIVISDQSKNKEIEEFVGTYTTDIPIIYIKSPGRSGSENMNNAIRHATGSIIKPMFQDDKAFSSVLLERVSQSESYWGAVGTVHIAKTGISLDRNMRPRRSKLQPFGINKLGCPSVIFFRKKDSLEFNKSLVNLMDCEFYQKLYATYGEPELINDPLVAVRIWDGTISSRIARFTNLKEFLKIALSQPYRYKVGFSARGMLPCFDLSGFENININIDQIKPRRGWNNYYFQVEPFEVNKDIYQIIQNKHKYKKIFAWDEKILNSCENSELFPYGTSWLRQPRLNGEIAMGVTMLSSKKTTTSGHKYRLEIIDKLRSIELDFPVHTHLSPPFIESKSDFLLQGKYSIVVENTQEKNWFTEKIVDSFRAEVVPIYWGCLNISDFFDPRGIISFQSVDELEAILKTVVSDKDYSSRRRFIKFNKVEAERYCCFNRRITNAIKRDLA